jgi:hypothetical protein
MEEVLEHGFAFGHFNISALLLTMSLINSPLRGLHARAR